MVEDENVINNENIENDENAVNNKIKDQKKIEVVTGNGDLNISPVSRYIEVEKPRPKENKKIVIPKVKDSISNKNQNKEA